MAVRGDKKDWQCSCRVELYTLCHRLSPIKVLHIQYDKRIKMSFKVSFFHPNGASGVAGPLCHATKESTPD